MNDETTRRNGAGEVDERRRAALVSLGKVMAYVPPAVVTFSMTGLSVREAHAYVTNITN
jgi:hypothetical protein